MLFGAVVYCGATTYYWKNVIKAERANHFTELNGFRLALMPLISAERDRHFVRQVRENRDAEIDLMKDVDDWEVGSWFGIPVFKTINDAE